MQARSYAIPLLCGQITPETQHRLPVIRILHRQRPKRPRQPHLLERSCHRLHHLRRPLHSLQPRIVIDHPVPLLPIHHEQPRPLLKEPAALTIHKTHHPAHPHPSRRNSSQQRRSQLQHPIRNRDHPPHIHRNSPNIVDVTTYRSSRAHISRTNPTPHKPNLPRVVHVDGNQIPNDKPSRRHRSHFQRSSRRPRSRPSPQTHRRRSHPAAPIRR